MQRHAVIAEHRSRLEHAHAALTREVQSARAGTAVDGQHRPENRGERGAVSAAGALAGALAARLRELEAHLHQLDAVALDPRDAAGPGAFVTAEAADGDVVRVVILPGAAGEALAAAPGFVAVSPASPLGRALVGARAGDVVAVTRRGTADELVVLEIA